MIFSWIFLLFKISNSIRFSLILNTPVFRGDVNATSNFENTEDVFNEFERITEIIQTFNLDLEKYRIFGVSHMYGLFGLAWHMYENGIQIPDIDTQLDSFYTDLREKNENPYATDYQISMNAGTKSRARRIRRINALLEYLGQNRIE